MILSPDQIQLLTGKQRRPSQVRELRNLGIQHKIRSDGFPIVSISHLEKTLDGFTETQADKGVKPSWENI